MTVKGKCDQRTLLEVIRRLQGTERGSDKIQALLADRDLRLYLDSWVIPQIMAMLPEGATATADVLDALVPTVTTPTIKLNGKDAERFVHVVSNPTPPNGRLKKAFEDYNRMKAPDVVSTPGRDELSQWFGLSRSSFCVMPRVLMEAMPDVWQWQMAQLLNEYSETWTKWPDGWSCRVQLTENGHLIPTPMWLVNYRHPQTNLINQLKGKEE